MSRVMIIGYGPLPHPGLRIFNAATLRTRQILHGVLADGHQAELYVLPLHGIQETNPDAEPALIEDQYEGAVYRRFTTHSGEFAVRTLNEEVQRLSPDAIVGVATYPSYIASMLATTTPLWCDLNGYWMAEMQAKCVATDDDTHLASAWNIERAILRRLDKFSAVSRPHLHAVFGELASVGRLNKYTFEYPFGSQISNSIHRWVAIEPSGNAAQKSLRGSIVPEDAFVLLWSGGFKVWSDIDMLLQALHEIMGRYREVHFVSTGGPLGSGEQEIYAQLEQAVAASPYRERFHLLGWLEHEKLRAICREADLGLNLDAPNYETIFGGRNRIHAMAEAGLPILTTLGTEISEWLDDAKAALIIPMRDSHAVLEAVEPKIQQRGKLQEFSRRASRLMEEDFTETHTTRPLCNWLANPQNAPDNFAKIKEGGADLVHLAAFPLNALEQQISSSEAPVRSHPNDGNSASSKSQEKDGSLLGRVRRILGLNPR